MSRVRWGQRGYSGCSMSYGSISAYEDGQRPKSRWTKGAMLDALAEAFSDCDKEMPESVSKMRKDDIFMQFFEWKSWHHTGKYATETDFYGVSYDAVDEM